MRVLKILLPVYDISVLLSVHYLKEKVNNIKGLYEIRKQEICNR